MTGKFVKEIIGDTTIHVGGTFAKLYKINNFVIPVVE